MKALRPRAIQAAVLALLAVSCSGEGLPPADSDSADPTSSDATRASVADSTHAAETEAASTYHGPRAGAAHGFAALAHTAISAANGATVTGNLGLSGAKIQNITGFEPPTSAFGTDSTPPNSLRTVLTQREVEALVGDLETRECDAHYTEAASSASGSVTLHPGVTCLNGVDSERLLSGRVVLDAGGDPNAFFVIRSDFTLLVADATQLVLSNGAQACGVFWQARQQVKFGARVEFVGTVIAGTGITMQSGSTLIGRALAQTEAVSLDRSTIVIPTFSPSGGARTCSHEQ